MGLGERLRSWDDSYERAVERTAPDEPRQQRLTALVVAALAVAVVVAKVIGRDGSVLAALLSGLVLVAGVLAGMHWGRRRRARTAPPTEGPLRSL